nr:hypothetical protein [Flavobacteriales bacterium]
MKSSKQFEKDLSVDRLISVHIESSKLEVKSWKQFEKDLSVDRLISVHIESSKLKVKSWKLKPTKEVHRASIEN